jgi:hypothetical protein
MRINKKRNTAEKPAGPLTVGLIRQMLIDAKPPTLPPEGAA